MALTQSVSVASHFVNDYFNLQSHNLLRVIHLHISAFILIISTIYVNSHHGFKSVLSQGFDPLLPEFSIHHFMNEEIESCERLHYFF